MSKIITTLAIGDEAAQMGSVSIPLMKDYAYKIGAEFEALSSSNLSSKFSPFYEKMQIADLLAKYEAVLFLDIDILVNPAAEDVFKHVAPGQFAAVPVDQVFAGMEKQKNLLDKYLGEINWTLPYFNSGVFVAWQQQRELFNSSDTLIDQWIERIRVNQEKALNDQNILNYRANRMKIEFTALPESFNFTKAYRAFHRRFGANFIHYAGLRGNRSEVMRKDARKLKMGGLGHLYTNPLLVKLTDRINLP